MKKYRVVLINSGELNNYTINAISEYNSKNLNQISYIYSEKLDKKVNNYDYDLLNHIIAANHTPDDCEILIFIGCDTCILNFEILLAYLGNTKIFDSIFAFRILDVKGISFKGSPRLPYIDESFFVINKRLFNKYGLGNKKLVNACHFFKHSQNQSLLQSLLEYTSKYSNFVNLYNKNSILNQYGVSCKFSFPKPFSICTKSSVVYADLNYNYKFKELLTMDVDNYLSNFKTNHKNLHLFVRLTYNFLKYLKSFYLKATQKEFKKTY